MLTIHAASTSTDTSATAASAAVSCAARRARDLGEEETSPASGIITSVRSRFRK